MAVAVVVVVVVAPGRERGPPEVVLHRWLRVDAGKVDEHEEDED